MKDKEMGKFRAWLIKKLGGYIKKEEKPIIIERVRPFTTFESQIRYSYYDYQCLCETLNGTRTVKKELWDKLGEDIIPYMTIQRFEDIKDLEIVFKARLTVAKE